MSRKSESCKSKSSESASSARKRRRLLAAKREPPDEEASTEKCSTDDPVDCCEDDGYGVYVIDDELSEEERVAASGATRETRAGPVPLPPPPREKTQHGPPSKSKPFGRASKAPSAQSAAASGAYTWKRQLKIMDNGDLGLAEPVVHIPRAARDDYQAAQERPRRSCQLYVDAEGASFAEKLEGHDVAELMLDWARQPAAPPHRREQAAAQVCHDIVWKREGSGSVGKKKSLEGRRGCLRRRAVH